MKEQFRTEEKHNKQAGFSLTELLVALIIIGILVVMAMPKFTSVISRTKNTEAKLMLNQIYMLEEAYWDEHDKYSTDLNAIGYKPDKLVTEDGSASV
ncbi:MAG: prepilin-type N-terminal cleavage/methylation domain-containing protein [Candidatus Marinimicrobia bacterium]|nr:prepilin-type N-terminal cleavage/methylation domain-containing protein [Candidatus Neomarinimicrobiota bacterium]